MERNYLPFEAPLKEIELELANCKNIGKKTGVDVEKVQRDVQDKLDAKIQEIHSSLSTWQKVALSRHPDRPYTLEYIEKMTEGNFIELHGDRKGKEDKAMVCSLGKIDGQSFVIIGQQKGVNTQMRRERNFGMVSPEGYRKAFRAMKLAEKFDIPILCLIDTPGAYPGVSAEKFGQGEAIARNIYEMINIRVPIQVVIIGEGASGGALGIGVGDRFMMMQYTWYSVISPESCSSILWRSWDHKEKAAEALKLIPEDLLKYKIIDEIVEEPLGGAHRDSDKAIQLLKETVLKNQAELSKIPMDKLLEQRSDKYVKIGVFKEL